MCAMVVSQLLTGVTTAGTYLTTQRFLSGVFAAGALNGKLAALAPIAMIMVALLATRGLADAVSTATSGRLGPRIARAANLELLERAVRVELAVIEDAAFHQLLESARRGADAVRRLTDRVVGMSTAAVSVCGMVVALAILDARLLPLLLLTLVPRGWGAARMAGVRYASAKRWMDLTRQVDQLGMLMTARRTAEEIRAHRAGGFLLREFRRLSAHSDGEQARLARQEAVTRLLVGAASGAAAVLVYGVLVLLTVTGGMSLAVAGAAALAIRSSALSLATLVTQFQQVYEDGLLVLDWRAACDSAELSAIRDGGSPPAADPRRISACRLTFRYPGTQRAAVDGVDLELRRGEIVALVGENGSGKSTVAKLLTGLYLPQGGAVTWDGVSTRDLDRHALFDHVALLSQSFPRWPFTARMNVAIGRSAEAVDEARLVSAAGRTGADTVIDGLDGGWDTLLAPEFFGGTDLSGGQWQRLGLARSWYRDARLLVVDEPTSALDPAAEIEVFDRIGAMARDGRTILLITHRLASVASADRIYVLDHGRIVEHGSHAQLIRADGKYAALYRLQAAQFQSDSACDGTG